MIAVNFTFKRQDEEPADSTVHYRKMKADFALLPGVLCSKLCGWTILNSINLPEPHFLVQ